MSRHPTDLVGEYLGHTAPKVNAVVRRHWMVFSSLMRHAINAYNQNGLILELRL